MDVLLFVFIILNLAASSLCGEYCWDGGRRFYCTYDCCGTYNDEYCCGAYAWIIALAVIGSLFFIAFIICVICMIKKKQTKGRVFNSSNQHQGQTTLIHMQPYGHPPPVYQQQGYLGQSQPSAPMNYGGDPAYPPMTY